MNVQIITTPGGEEMAVLPLAEFQALLARAEMAEIDAEAGAILERVKAGQEEVFPAAVVNAILDGANPVKALREHRKMTQRALAGAAGINAVYLSQIERGERAGSLATLSALAKALNVDPVMLLPGGK